MSEFKTNKRLAIESRTTYRECFRAISIIMLAYTLLIGLVLLLENKQ